MRRGQLWQTRNGFRLDLFARVVRQSAQSPVTLRVHNRRRHVVTAQKRFELSRSRRFCARDRFALHSAHVANFFTSTSPQRVQNPASRNLA